MQRISTALRTLRNVSISKNSYSRFEIIQQLYKTVLSSIALNFDDTSNRQFRLTVLQIHRFYEQITRFLVLFKLSFITPGIDLM